MSQPKTHRYRVRYRDEDPACPVFSVVIRAHSADDARERFAEGNDLDGGGWKVLGVNRLPCPCAGCAGPGRGFTVRQPCARIASKNRGGA